MKGLQSEKDSETDSLTGRNSPPFTSTYILAKPLILSMEHWLLTTAAQFHASHPA